VAAELVDLNGRKSRGALDGTKASCCTPPESAVVEARNYPPFPSPFSEPGNTADRRTDRAGRSIVDNLPRGHLGMRTGLSRARQAHSSLVQRRSRNYRTAPIGRAAGRLVRCDRGVLRGRAQQTGPANLRVMPRPAWRSRARGVVRGDPKSNVEGARQAGFTAFWFTGDEDVPPRRTRLFGLGR